MWYSIVVKVVRRCYFSPSYSDAVLFSILSLRNALLVICGTFFGKKIQKSHNIDHSFFAPDWFSFTIFNHLEPKKRKMPCSRCFQEGHTCSSKKCPLVESCKSTPQKEAYEKRTGRSMSIMKPLDTNL